MVSALPKVIQDLIRDFMFSFEHPVCKILREERSKHVGVWYNELGFYPGHHLQNWKNMFVLHFPHRSLRSSYCTVCGEFVTTCDTGGGLFRCNCNFSYQSYCYFSNH